MAADKTLKRKSAQPSKVILHDILGTAIALLTLGLPLYSTAHYSHQAVPTDTLSLQTSTGSQR